MNLDEYHPNLTLTFSRDFNRTVLRILTSAPWFIFNKTLHEDLQIPSHQQQTTKLLCKTGCSPQQIAPHLIKTNTGRKTHKKKVASRPPGH